MRIKVIDGYVEDVERLRAALEASCVVGAWEWDHAGGVVVYDEGAAVFLTGNAGLADRPIRGPMALAAVHPDDLTWLMDHMVRAVQSGDLVLAEYRVFRADGTIRWLLSRGRTQCDADGTPRRSRGILMDITEIRDGGDRYVLGKPPAARALPAEVDTGSAQESATKQRLRAVPDRNAIGHGSSAGCWRVHGSAPDETDGWPARLPSALAERGPYGPRRPCGT